MKVDSTLMLFTKVIIVNAMFDSVAFLFEVELL